MKVGSSTSAVGRSEGQLTATQAHHFFGSPWMRNPALCGRTSLTYRRSACRNSRFTSDGQLARISAASHVESSDEFFLKYYETPFPESQLPCSFLSNTICPP